MCDDCGTRVHLDSGVITVTAPQELAPIVIKPARTSRGLGKQLVDWDAALTAGADPRRTMLEHREVLRRAADSFRNKKRGPKMDEEEREKAYVMFNRQHAIGDTDDLKFKQTVAAALDVDMARVNRLRGYWKKARVYK